MKRAVLFLLFAALPFVPHLTHPGVFCADPQGELPVKLWGAHTFLHVGFFGGQIDGIGFPNAGPLNNPDLLLTAWFGAFSGLLGDPLAWNLFLILQIFATMWATAALAREVTEDEAASWTAGVAMGLTPMLLVYCVAGAVTDMLSVWPYALAARDVLRAVRGDTPGKDAAFAGMWAGLGFATCPYDTLVFLIWLPAVPFAVPVLWREAADAEGTTYALRRVATIIGAAGLVGGLIAGVYAAQLHAIMADAKSQMSDALVQSTRHAPPFPFLEPLHNSRYVGVLYDYFAVGKKALITREAGSRYLRAYSPGILVWLLAGWGLVRGRARLSSAFWLLAAAFAIVASLGPFATLDGHRLSDGTNNPVYLLAYDFLGSKMLLEPFRYAIAAAMALAIAAALGAAALPRRARMVLPGLILAEVLIVSPVPTPLPAARLDAPAVYGKLGTLLPPGPILELPYFDKGSGRFVREQIYWQLLHGRPIPNAVAGFPPDWLRDNAFTATLLAIEGVSGPLAVKAPTPDAVGDGRDAFVEAGFAGIVVEPGRYRDSQRFEQVRSMLSSFGDPVYQAERVVWKTARAAQDSEPAP